MPVENQMPVGTEEPVANIQKDPESFERMASPEEIRELSELMDDIEGKYQEMSSAIIHAEEGSEELRREIVVEMFQAMEEMGVDLNNIEQVKAFLDDLKTSNPELYEMFVAAFNHLLGDEGFLEEEGTEEGMMEEGMGEGMDEGLILPEGEMPADPSNPGLAGMAPPPMSPGGPGGAPGGSVGPAGAFPNLRM